jgi:hypothetical protein
MDVATPYGNLFLRVCGWSSLTADNPLRNLFQCVCRI